MIDKIIHSFEPIDYKWRFLFDDFVFMRWDKNKTNELKVLYDHGGIFFNDLVPLHNFYNELDVTRFNIWETKVDDQRVALDSSLMAVERNFRGCRVMMEKIKDNNQMIVLNDEFKENKDAFRVLHWNSKSFRKR